MALSLLETFRSRPDVARIVAALRATGSRALDILYPPCLPRLPQGHGCPSRALPCLLGRDALHRAALLRAAGNALRPGYAQPGADLARGDGRSAGVRPSRAVVRYDDGPARRLVHRLKYSDRLELAGPMGAWMARAGAEILQEADLIVPVPRHRFRLISRRFNQAAALACCVSQACAVPVDTQALVRVKQTPPQWG